MALDARKCRDLHLSLDRFQEKLCHNLYSLWTTSQHCDLTFQASGGVVRVHSCIITAFSSTVADILSTLDQKFHEAHEKSQKYVTIVVDHLDVEVLQSIVSFTYTGQLVTSIDHTKNLLDASKWLKMQDLVSLIERSIYEREEENVEHCYNPNQVWPSAGLISSTSNDDPTLPIISQITHALCDKTVQPTDVDHQSESVRCRERNFSPPRSLVSPCTRKISTQTQTPYEVSSGDMVTVSGQSNAAISSSSFSNVKGVNTSSQRASFSNSSSKKHSSTKDSRRPVLSVSNPKKYGLIKSAKFFLQSDSSDSLSRRGGRKRRPTKKLTESYLFSSGELDEIHNLQDCSVSLVKVEVNDLSTRVLLLPTAQSNSLHRNPGPLSISSEGGNVVVSDEVENKNISFHKVDPSVLDGLIGMEEEDDVDDLEETESPMHRAVRDCGPSSLVCCDDTDTIPGPTSSASKISPTTDVTTSKDVAQKLTMSPGSDATDVDVSFDNGLEQKNGPNSADLGAPSDFVFNILRCAKCYLKFDDADKYNEHVNNHPVYLCEECPLSFPSKGRLTRHYNSDHLKKSYLSCPSCSFRASTCGELCRHSTQEHGQPKPYVCPRPGCSFRASRPSIVSTHCSNVHDQNSCVCNHCGKTFKSAFTLEQHIPSCLRSEEHLCDLCGAAFNLKQFLTNHKNTVHYNIRKYKCKDCGKAFASGANLRRHLRIHNDVKPYSCPVCAEKFRHTNTLKGHLKIHQQKGDCANVENPYDYGAVNYKRRKSETIASS